VIHERVSFRGKRLSSAAVCLTAVLASGCGDGNRYAAPPPPQVTVSHPAAREVTTYLEYAGHTASIESVEIRARVQGVLESMHFAPGTDVKKGALLFVIEPALYEARAAQAQADLQSATAQLAAAGEQLAITEAIFARKAGSRTDLVEKTQARDQALAAVEQAKANLIAAQLDLTYTHIYAPTDGRIDRNYVDVGNLVGANEPTLLATLVRLDPIYAYFEASERDVLVYRDLDRRGETATAEGRRVEVTMGLSTDEGFPHQGEIDYASNRVDPSTGTFELRAVFPNPDGVILPGFFARVRVPFTRGRELLIPEEAFGADLGGRFLLLVDEQNKVHRRQVEVGALVDGMRVVSQGVTESDWVVVNGLQRARAGIEVNPQKTEPPSETAESGAKAGDGASAAQ
jgi:RND family efflux transporter MFP subunit